MTSAKLREWKANRAYTTTIAVGKAWVLGDKVDIV